MRSEELFRLWPIQTEGGELIQPRHEMGGAVFADPNDLRGCRVAGLEEVACVVTVAELRGVLPEHLIDQVVAVEVDRGRRHAALWLRAAERLSGEKNDITDLHVPGTKLAE